MFVVVMKSPCETLCDAAAFEARELPDGEHLDRVQCFDCARRYAKRFDAKRIKRVEFTTASNGVHGAMCARCRATRRKPSDCRRSSDCGSGGKMNGEASSKKGVSDASHECLLGSVECAKEHGAAGEVADKDGCVLSNLRRAWRAR